MEDIDPLDRITFLDEDTIVLIHLRMGYIEPSLSSRYDRDFDAMVCMPGEKKLALVKHVQNSYAYDSELHPFEISSSGLDVELEGKGETYMADRKPLQKRLEVAVSELKKTVD